MLSLRMMFTVFESNLKCEKLSEYIFFVSNNFFVFMACEKRKHVSDLMDQLRLNSLQHEANDYDGNDIGALESDSIENSCDRPGEETQVSYVDTDISREDMMARFNAILSKLSNHDSTDLIRSMFALIHDMRLLMDDRNLAYRLARLCVLCNLFDDALNICNKNNINSKLVFGNAESDPGLESLHFVPHPPVFSFSGKVEVPDFRIGECITFIQETTKMEGVRARKIKPFDTLVIPHEAVKDHLCVLIFKYPEIITVDAQHPTGAVVDSVIYMICKIQDLEMLEETIQKIENNERLPMHCVFFYSSKDVYRPGIKRFRKRHGQAITIDPFHSVLVQYFFFNWSFQLVRNKEVQSFMSSWHDSFVAVKDAPKSLS